MPFDDPILDSLARERDQANQRLAERRSALDSAHNELERLQGAYGYRLDYYKTHIPELKTNIDHAFAMSRSCYESHDGAGAKSWSEEAHRLIDERKAAYDDKGRMIDELQAARGHFQSILAEFREAKRIAEAARDAFMQRLNFDKEQAAQARALREQERRRREERMQKRAANRQQFVEWATAIFMLKSLEAYQDKREEDSRRDEKEERIGRQPQEPGVQVLNGYSRDNDVYTTDIVIYQRGLNEHLHIIYDEDGNELLNEWRPNTPRSSR